MLTKEQQAQIAKDLAEIEAFGRQTAKSEAAIKDEIDIKAKTDPVELSAYQQVKKEWTDGVAKLKRILDLNEVRLIEENVSLGLDNPANANVKILDTALYIDGIIKLNEALPILKYDPEAYKIASTKNPWKLKADLRIKAEQEVVNLRQLLVNSIPLEKEKINSMDPKQAMEAFKGVVLNHLDALQAFHLRHPNITEVSDVLGDKECLVKFVSYPLEMSNIYVSGWDASLPIDRGLVSWEESLMKGYTENGKEVKGINQLQAEREDIDAKLGNKRREETLIDESIRLKKIDFDNVSKSVMQKEETGKSLDLQISEKRKELERLNKIEKEEEETEEGEES